MLTAPLSKIPGSAPVHRLVDIPSRRRLRSASSLQLDVPRSHHRTIGDRAFAAAGPTLWNSLTHDVIISMTTFFFLVVLEVFTQRALTISYVCMFFYPILSTVYFLPDTVYIGL